MTQGCEQSILVRSSVSNTMEMSMIRKVMMDIAVPQVRGTTDKSTYHLCALSTHYLHQMTGGPPAEVEECLCPPGYRGLACEECAEPHTRQGGACVAPAQSPAPEPHNPRVRQLVRPQQPRYGGHGEEEASGGRHGESRQPTYSQRMPGGYGDQQEDAMKGYPRPRPVPPPEEAMKGYPRPRPSPEDSPRMYGQSRPEVRIIIWTTIQYIYNILSSYLVRESPARGAAPAQLRQLQLSRRGRDGGAAGPDHPPGVWISGSSISTTSIYNTCCRAGRRSLCVAGAGRGRPTPGRRWAGS